SSCPFPTIRSVVKIADTSVGDRRKAAVVVRIHAAVADSLTISFRSGAGSVNTLLPLQQFYVGTSYIGGEDQGYIACP
ncbi:MAG: hypothetical protein ACXV5J_11790, partial [Candidatus Angelobacter sp.]